MKFSVRHPFCFPGYQFALLALVVGALSTDPCLADIAGPRGIYALGSGRDNANTPVDERVTGIRDYDFVDGYTLRLHWEDVDLGGGVYDFGVINEAIGLLENNQHATRMNLELLVLTPPTHIVENATETWEHFKAGTLPMPWDMVAQQGYADLVAALASHSVFDATAGVLVPLAEHPVLGSLNASVPGISGIRDNGGNSGLTKLVDLPSYDRQKFVDAVLQAVGVNRNAFSEQAGFLGYFSMTDSENANFGGETLNETLIGALLTEFNNPGHPDVGLFQELLSDVGPNPSHSLGQNLLAAKDDTYIMFQALASWLNPHTGGDKLTSMNPSNGIELGFNNYGATFFELYLGDIDGAQNGAVDAEGSPLIDRLAAWHDFLEALAADFDLDGDIDGADLAEWQAGFLADGLTGADFLSWQRNLGHVQPGGVSSLQVVPEPSTALLAGVVLCLYNGLFINGIRRVKCVAIQKHCLLGLSLYRSPLGRQRQPRKNAQPHDHQEGTSDTPFTLELGTEYRTYFASISLTRITLSQGVRKPPFQTWAEITRKIEMYRLDEDRQADLWECLFLTTAEIEELLADVKQAALHPCLGQ